MTQPRYTPKVADSQVVFNLESISPGPARVASAIFSGATLICNATFSPPFRVDSLVERQPGIWLLRR